jgi:flagellar L-ring protein precursor FlgH
MNEMSFLRGLGLATLLGAAMLASGCSAFTRIAEVGEAPKLTQIQNPAADPNYRQVSMPMPQPVPESREPNSLWRTGARAFFKDQRASRVGDIVTVLITIEDKAQIANTSKRSREAGEKAGMPALMGYETKLHKFLPETVDPTDLLDLSSTSNSTGTGSVNRTESIELKIAAVVSQILPNGNMVLNGRQEVRVNYELRDLQIAGIIRPEDITSQNTVSYEKIAEARVVYGGRGQITDVQQPRYGQQLLDIVFPF